MTMKAFKYCFLLMAMGFVGSAWAQDMAMSDMPATIKLALPQVEKMVLERNSMIQAALYREKASDQKSSQTLSPNDPMLMWDNSNLNNDSNGFSQQMIMVEEQFKFPGKSLVAAGADDSGAKEMRAFTNDARRMALYKVRQAYWEFYFHSKIDQVLKESEGNWQSFGQGLKSKTFTGQWLSVKAIHTQMEVAKASNYRITTAKSLIVASANLNHILNLSHKTQYILQGPITFVPFEKVMEQSVGEGLLVNPEIEAARKEIDKRKSLQVSADMEHLPDFLVRGYAIQNPGDSGLNDYGLRVGITLPIFFATKQDKAAQESAYQTQAAQQDLVGKQNEVTHMVEEAYVNAESQWRLLNLYEQGGLKAQVEKAWTASKRSYRNEQMSFSELIDNYDGYLEVLTDYYHAQADYGQALARLQYEIGEVKVTEAKDEN
jgi:outer membrane protein TolC